jgi:tol-pal system-associated acyl-CoA thioesterase
MMTSFTVHVYYEDTDHSGLVYHPNYLKYFERAREHLLGREKCVNLYHDHGLGFVVYKAQLQFNEGARFGDTLEIRTRVEIPSDYRAVFHQSAWKEGGSQAMVEAQIQLVCVNEDNKLNRLPKALVALVQ